MGNGSLTSTFRKAPKVFYTTVIILTTISNQREFQSEDRCMMTLKYRYVVVILPTSDVVSVSCFGVRVGDVSLYVCSLYF